MNGQAHGRQCLGLAVIGLVGLNGCALIGDHIKSNFACTAPTGICAPTATIDDRALAMISGETLPLAPVTKRPQGRSPRTAQLPEIASPETRIAMRSADARRTQEHVLRVVFQPYVDARGRLHEASAIHMVVASGQWRDQVDGGAEGLADRAIVQVSVTPSPDEGGGNAQAHVAPVPFDPNMPDPAVVAAARARASNPAVPATSNAAVTPLAQVRGSTDRDAASAAAKPDGGAVKAAITASGFPGAAPEDE